MTAIIIIIIFLVLYLVRNRIKGVSTSQWVYVTIMFGTLYLACMQFVGGIYNVPSASMEPTLKIGDYIAGVRVGGVLDNGEIKRGDVVIFKAPSVPRTMYIKRVIGIPGDNIEFHDDKTFTVNGKTLGKLKAENDKFMIFVATDDRKGLPYEFIIDKSIPFLNAKDQWSVPKDFYFMAGDNRDHSWDSRYWENPPGTPVPLRGLVRSDKIVARYISTLFNFNLFSTYDPLEVSLKVLRNNDN